MVVNGDSEVSLCLILANDILVEIILDLLRFGQFVQVKVLFLSIISLQDTGSLNYLIGLSGAIFTDLPVDT